eukprot:6178252-Pleurochrysis_carterae.AAC.1
MHARRALSKKNKGACPALQRKGTEPRAICPQKSGWWPPQGKAKSQEGGHCSKKVRNQEQFALKSQVGWSP